MMQSNSAFVYLQEAFGLCIDSSKAVWHELHHCCPDGFTAQLHIIQKLLGHTALANGSLDQTFVRWTCVPGTCVTDL